MACNPSPTLTLFGQSTSSSVYTTFSASVSSLPSVVTSSQSETCVSIVTGSDNLTTCASTSTINEANTIPGGGTAVQVPIVTTVIQVQTFPTETLFGSCTSTADSGPTTQPRPSSSSPTSTTTISTITTPPPVVVTSHSTTTLPNGSALVTTVVVTSSVAPTYVYVPATTTDAQTQGNHTGSHGNAKLGAIIGGSLGGFLGLLGLVGLVWFFLYKRKAWDDIFDNDDIGTDFRPARLVRDRSRRISLDVTSSMEPKPYQYGLVGQNTTPPFSPPASPTGQHHPHLNHGQGWSSDYNPNQPYSPEYHQNGQGPGQHPQHIMHDNGQSYTPDYNQNTQGPSQQHTMHDNGQSYTPNYSQNPQQYPPDHVDTLHHRHPSGTSLLYTPLILPATTRISPDPSMASVYSSNSGPGYSRESSGSRILGSSRPSTGGSVGSRPSMDASIYPSAMAAYVPPPHRRQRRSSRTDEFGVSRPSTAEYGPRPPSASDHANVGRHQSTHSRRTSSSGRPTSPREPRVLALTNWNPSTDNVTLDGPPLLRPSMAPTPDQPRHAVNSSVSSTTAVPADTSRPSGAAPPSSPASAQAGPSSRPENVILHTDGGRVQEESTTEPTEDIKEIPAQAPPAYSE